MGFHLFAKKVRDEELCFVRDLIEVGSVIASVSSVPVMREMILPIIDKYHLNKKLDELNENGHYIVLDCYPTSIHLKKDRARDLLLLSKKLPLNSNQKVQILVKAAKCISKMGFSYDDKVQLIKDCIIDTTGNEELDKFLIDNYLEIIS